MKSLPLLNNRGAKPRLPPLTIWQILLAHVMQQHYGLTLNDTPFRDDRVIQEHIDAGITLTDAVNFLVEKYQLIRIDRQGLSSHETSLYLRTVDILRARRATGLLKTDVK